MKKFFSITLAILLGQVLLAQQGLDGVVQNHLNGVAKSKTDDSIEWKIKSQAPSLNPNLQHVYVQQYVNGIPLVDGTLKLTVKNGNQVTFEIDQLIEGASKMISTSSKSAMSADAAINAVVREHGLARPKSLVPTFQKSTVGDQVLSFYNSGITADDEPIKASKVYRLHEGELKLSWNVILYQKDGKHWWSADVDMATGEILYENDWVISCNFDVPGHENHNHGAIEHHDEIDFTKEKVYGPMTKAETAALAPDSYNVYPMPIGTPDEGPRSIVVDPANLTASPFGWHDTNGSPGAEFTTTQGNNVLAQDDSNGNNGSGFRPDGGASLDFDFPVNLNQAPRNYRDASIVNLFYWNNIMHDVWYQYGFDEASGNFQENNYGNGGSGGDSVFADAQDGSGTNNANFGTPGDGGNPRMQMFLWNRTNPNRDGSFDNIIIAHEYGHGISTRLVGGRNSNTLGGSEQMGEGWSDWFGLMLTMKAGDRATDGRGVGPYVLGQGVDGAGIRPTRYSTNRSINNTDYADIGGLARPHGVGYAWATILWDMTWGLIDAEGFDPDFYNGTGGNNIAMALVIEGLKNTANNPGFVSGRDGILQADQDLYNGRYNCIIWTAFAERGVGQGANENNNGGTNGQTDQTVSFTNPCTNPDPNPGPTNPECRGDVASFPFTEGFENGLGEWSDATSGDDLNFTRTSGGTPSADTGPDAAAEGTSYIFVEASGDGTGFPNKVALLNSPCLNFANLANPTLTFQYHMLGSEIETLDVEARINNDGDWVSIFNQTGAQGNAWNAASVDLAAYAGESSVQLRFNVVTGDGANGWQSDIALDDVSIGEAATDPDPTPGPGTDVCSGDVSNFPFADSFETSLGQWTNATEGDDIDFTRDSGGTPSASTGPSTGADGDFYIYVEASGNGTGFPNKRAILNSPCLNFTNLAAPSMAFQYHMVGSEIETLDVEARVDNGTWTNVFNRTGAQGTDWNAANLDLSAYAGEAVVQLRFIVVTGDGTQGWQSDIAIDAISIGDSAGDPNPDPDPSCPALNFNDFTITGFSNQDSAGDFSVVNGGAGLTLQNNTWKFISLNYNVTANTVIEFDFTSSSQGEIHGVGFEDDNTLTQTRYFKVHGSQSYGVLDFDNYAGGTTTYTIPVGSFYTGAMDRLVFINDNDAGSGNNSTFSNVKIYEGSCGGTAAFASFGPISPTLGDGIEGAISSISLSPNPVVDMFQFNVVGKSSEIITATFYNLIGQKQAEVQLQSGVNTMSAKSMFLSKGVYLVKITSLGEPTMIKKVIVH